MRTHSCVAAAFCAMVAFPTSCVIENGTPPPPAPAPAPRPKVPAPPPAPEAGAAPDVAAPDVAAPPAVETKTTAAPIESSPGAPAAEFTACQANGDCVAVPRNSCCNNGYREAVNAAKADAYKASFSCPERGPCPMFRIRDNRTPTCEPTTHRCVMIGP